MNPSPEFVALVKAYKAQDPAASGELDALAKAGDRDALMLLGEHHLIGFDAPRNFERAYRLISKAAERGQEQALRTRAYLTARGIGRSANPALARNLLAKVARTDRFAAVQHALLGHLACRVAVKRIVPEVISADPAIVMWRGLFNQAEYGYLRRMGEPTMKPAMIANPATGTAALDPVRRSDATAVPMIAHDLIVHEIVSTIAEATGTHVNQGESLALLRYGPGQEYRVHHDAYEAGWSEPQRSHTALIWLNDGYEGGETHFPDLGLKVRGNPGDMLVFANLTADGAADPRMKHAGLPVVRGEKWLATRWISVVDRLKLPKDG